MENCLVTKLKKDVANDNLPKLGVLKLHLHPTTYDLVIGPSKGKSVKLNVLDGKHVEIGGVNVSEMTLTYNTSIKIVEDATIEMESKYDIKHLGSFMSTNLLLVSDLVYLTSLTELSKCTLYGKLSDLAKLSTLRTLNMYDNRDDNFEDYSENNYRTSLRALNITIFSRTWCTQHDLSFEGTCMPDTLEEIYLGDGSFKGSIESFVVGIRSNGKTVGSIQIANNANPNVTFQGNSIGDTDYKQLSWTSDTITYNGVTINA